LSLPVLDAIAAEAAPQDPIGLGSTRRRPVRTLIGAVLGFGLGLCAAWLLLILADPAVRWPLWNDPVALWESVDDVWVRMSVLLIAAGFVLLGALFSRPRRSP
jgi:NhaP-type Na+/H+ or K+/H+ antiporter